MKMISVTGLVCLEDCLGEGLQKSRGVCDLCTMRGAV